MNDSNYIADLPDTCQSYVKQQSPLSAHRLPPEKSV